MSIPFKLAATLLLAVASTHALPVKTQRDATLSDTDILQFALTLEHLETAFYTKGLNDFDDNAFRDAGLPDFTRGRIQQIQEHESTHVDLLTSLIGESATQACEYSFPFNDPKSFVGIASVLENGGTSAYLGATSLLTDKSNIISAGSILTTEARQNAWIHSAVLKLEPWSRSFDTPLTANQVFSLAHGFITSCPSSNPSLPVTALPPLSVAEQNSMPGSTISLQFDGDVSNSQLALLHGLDTTIVPIDANRKAQLPSDLQGTVYGVVTSKGVIQVADDNTLAGVAIFQFPFSSQVGNH